MTEMMDLIKELWFLKRDIVSDGYDQALQRLAQEVPMIIHEYPTGETCWTWKVPEKWTCDEAYLETMDGKRIIDVNNHPLHVVSYSLPFEGIVKRDDLLPHLHTHKKLPDAIPFIFKYYDRDWGLCLPKTTKDQLNDSEYRVSIRTRFESGKLKVGEIIIPGESKKSFMLAAHLCHPAMANDDLSGCVVSLDVAKALLKRRPYYTYRLLILPETIGSVAYLSHCEDLIPDMIGGLFLEILGVQNPHILQTSFTPDSQPDKCLISALKGLDPTSSHQGYRKVIDNDERQFNSPGVRVPMLSFSRAIYPKDSADYPFHEYHSNLDTPEIITRERLETSRDIVLKMLEAWENNQYIVNQFKGEIFCSGNKIWIDYNVNPEGHRRLFEIMERCDGSRTVADIACELNISFQAVWEVADLLHSRNLVSFSRQPAPSDPVRE